MIQAGSSFFLCFGRSSSYRTLFCKHTIFPWPFYVAMDSWSELFGGRPRLPTECSCGDTQNATCAETGLRNHHNFPPFAYLPEENDIDETYYGLDEESGFMYSPVRHWALVGEVIDISFFLRPRVTIRTRFGEEVLVNFHLEGKNKPTFFDWTDLQPQTTQGAACLVIFYPLNRTFLDMNQGVRQENPDTAMVFPTGFEELADEVHGYSTPVVCNHCSKPETSERKLSRCTRCKIARYCGRDCQAPHWRRSHKKLCQHAAMLSNLATLDFSSFHNYIDWKFVIKDPPTKEEKAQRSKKAKRDMLYEMGARDPDLSSMPTRLEALLSAIESKSLETDPATQKYLEISRFVRDLEPEGAAACCGPVGETFLVQSLRSFLQAVTKTPGLRHHVVDLKPQGREYMSHFYLEQVLDGIFFALPIWQHEESIGGMSWAVESHAIFSRYKPLYESNRRVWNILRDDDALIIKNHVADTIFFAADNMTVVAAVGEHMATDMPQETVVRVLRVTANESWKDEIRRIATAQNVPDNVYTLWIREDVPLCGRFNPPRVHQSLVDQLLDRERISHTEMLLRGLGAGPANILRPREDNDEEDLDLLECASCGCRKPRKCFSKNQRRTKGPFARCKDCIRECKDT